MSVAGQEEVGGTSTMTASLHVWCLLPDQPAHIKPVEAFFGPRAHFTYDHSCDAVALQRAQPDAVLCVNEYPSGVATCLEKARSLGIPSLVLQDGILEWRCQYENPLFGSGGGPPQHQPVLADKIACLGEQSARIIGSWGNESKVEVTGAPRLDHLLGRLATERRRPGSRLLIMTAKNPGFTEKQRETTIRSLSEVRSELEKRPDIEVFWRVSGEVSRRLELENKLSPFASEDLARVLDQVDGVLTTPSTSILEAMIAERPVAMLDYHNVPHFVATVWQVGARDQILPVLDDLLQPSVRKMHFQKYLLHENLLCESPAAPRVGELIERMTALASASRAQGLAPALPANLMGELQSQGFCEPPNLAEFYPDQPAFQASDRSVLQAQLARMHKENARLERELEYRTVANALFKMGQLVSGRLRKSR